MTYACPCAGPIEGARGDSAPGGATEDCVGAWGGGTSSALAAGGVVFDASGVGALASGPDVSPSVRSIHFKDRDHLRRMIVEVRVRETDHGPEHEHGFDVFVPLRVGVRACGGQCRLRFSNRPSSTERTIAWASRIRSSGVSNASSSADGRRSRWCFGMRIIIRKVLRRDRDFGSGAGRN